MPQSSEFIRVKDAARRVGIRTDTMYDWINRGYFPVHRFGKFIRIRAEDFEAFLVRTRMNDVTVFDRIDRRVSH